MKKARLIGLSLIMILVLANVAVYFTGTTYIYKALVYQQPGIHDLDIFPYRTISPDPGATPFPKAEDYNKNVLPQDLQNVLLQYESVAFLVLQHGEIRHELYWDDADETVNSNSFSAAKSIVSVLVGIAIDQGKIQSVDQPVGDFLPEFSRGGKEFITIKDLLRMASGLNFHEAYNKPFSHTTDAYYGSDLARLVNSLEPEEKPGVRYRYRSGDSLILGMVLEKATGMSLSEFAQEFLWKPIGAVHPAQWSTDKQDGIEKAYCCFYSNARDFARVGYLYLNGGKIGGKQIVSSEYVQDSTIPTGLPDYAGEKVDYYGYQWWLMEKSGVNVFYARGILGQYIFVVPEYDMVVVRLGHKRSKNKIDHHPEDVHRIVEGFLKTFVPSDKMMAKYLS